MRSTDDLTPEPPFKGFGERVVKPNPVPSDELKSVPGAPSGIKVGSDGKMQTTTHAPTSHWWGHYQWI